MQTGPEPRRAIAQQPTLSLLRLAAWERLAGAGVAIAALWAAVAWAIR
ncbi:hypothetical protein [Terrarubrum flagellatum]